VSQTLVSLWEHGNRKLPAKRVKQLRRLGVELDATLLPMRKFPAVTNFSQEVANLGYPGFAHFVTGEPELNPAQFLVLALSQKYLDRRTAEALPWVALHYWNLDWDWTRRESKVRDLQNRLGFTVTLAKKLAVTRDQPDAVRELTAQEEALRDSLLAREDTYCNDRMTAVERDYLQSYRPVDAAAWHVLSDLALENIAYA
jgi:hypothetical protein